MMYLHIFIPVFNMNMVKYINSHNKNSFSIEYHTHLVFLCFKATVQSSKNSLLQKYL